MLYVAATLLSVSASEPLFDSAMDDMLLPDDVMSLAEVLFRLRGGKERAMQAQVQDDESDEVSLFQSSAEASEESESQQMDLPVLDVDDETVMLQASVDPAGALDMGLSDAGKAQEALH